MILASTGPISERNRLGLIETLSNKIVTKEDDVSIIDDTLAHLLNDCDKDALIHERDKYLRGVCNKLISALERNGVSVDAYRFSYDEVDEELANSKPKTVFGYTLMLGNVAERQFKGDAVVHLLRYGPKNYKYSVSAKYRMPSNSKMNKLPRNHMIATVQSSFDKMGFNVNLMKIFANQRVADWVDNDDGRQSDPRFVELKPGASLDTAERISSRLEPYYKQVKIIKDSGQYTIAASKRKRKRK